MRLKTLIAVPACALALAGMSAAPAHAQGQTERGPEHANSLCSYSGLNDEPDDPLEGGRVQSYGQIVRAGGKAFAPSPSLLCNGHRFPLQEMQPPPE